MFSIFPGIDMQHFLPPPSCFSPEEWWGPCGRQDVLKHAIFRCSEVSCPHYQDGSVKLHPTITAK